MEAKLRRTWTDNLRSGKFKQGSGRLKLTPEAGEPLHCCLGVLCVIAGLPEELRTVGGGWTMSAFDGCTAVLGTDLLDRFDLPTVQAQYLMSLNDGGHTFAEIADYIETSVEITP